MDALTTPLLTIHALDTLYVSLYSFICFLTPRFFLAAVGYPYTYDTGLAFVIILSYFETPLIYALLISSNPNIATLVRLSLDVYRFARKAFVSIIRTDYCTVTRIIILYDTIIQSRKFDNI